MLALPEGSAAAATTPCAASQTSDHIRVCRSKCEARTTTGVHTVDGEARGEIAVGADARRHGRGRRRDDPIAAWEKDINLPLAERVLDNDVVVEARATCRLTILPASCVHPRRATAFRPSNSAAGRLALP
jgi:hypothetical protein